jgi:hypothetical protein
MCLATPPSSSGRLNPDLDESSIRGFAMAGPPSERRLRCLALASPMAVVESAQTLSAAASSTDFRTACGTASPTEAASLGRQLSVGVSTCASSLTVAPRTGSWPLNVPTSLTAWPRARASVPATASSQ